MRRWQVRRKSIRTCSFECMKKVYISERWVPEVSSDSPVRDQVPRRCARIWLFEMIRPTGAEVVSENSIHLRRRERRGHFRALSHSDG